MAKANRSGYAAPISLKSLVDILGIDLLGRVVGSIPGAVALEPKGKEHWRYALGGAVVIGYIQSATVTGEHTSTLRQVEVQVRAAAQPEPDEQAAIQLAVDMAFPFVAQYIAVVVAHDGFVIALNDLLDAWLALTDVAQAYAFSLLGQRVPHQSSKAWYVQIVRTLLISYGQGAADENEHAALAAFDDAVEQDDYTPIPVRVIQDRQPVILGPVQSKVIHSA